MTQRAIGTARIQGANIKMPMSKTRSARAFHRRKIRRTSGKVIERFVFSPEWKALESRAIFGRAYGTVVCMKRQSL